MKWCKQTNIVEISNKKSFATYVSYIGELNGGLCSHTSYMNMSNVRAIFSSYIEYWGVTPGNDV